MENWPIIPGKYEVGNNSASVAIATLNNDFSFDAKYVAISGRIMTENLGVTRIICNVLSNPNIRYLVLCGKEVHGHFPGDALVSFYNKGYELSKLGVITIKDTKAADPRLPIKPECIEEVHKRLKRQITLVDLIGESNMEIINGKISECVTSAVSPLDFPYIVELKTEGEKVAINDDVAVYSKVRINHNLVNRR